MNFELTMEDFTIIQNALHYYKHVEKRGHFAQYDVCLLYTSPSPRDVEESRMPSSA